jgi:hypothetical protein
VGAPMRDWDLQRTSAVPHSSARTSMLVAKAACENTMRRVEFIRTCLHGCTRTHALMHARPIRVISMCECKRVFLTAITADARAVYRNGRYLSNKLLHSCVQGEECGTPFIIWNGRTACSQLLHVDSSFGMSCDITPAR